MHVSGDKSNADLKTALCDKSNDISHDPFADLDGNASQKNRFRRFRHFDLTALLDAARYGESNEWLQGGRGLEQSLQNGLRRLRQFRRFAGLLSEIIELRRF